MKTIRMFTPHGTRKAGVGVEVDALPFKPSRVFEATDASSNGFLPLRAQRPRPGACGDPRARAPPMSLLEPLGGPRRATRRTMGS